MLLQSGFRPVGRISGAGQVGRIILLLDDSVLGTQQRFTVLVPPLVLPPVPEPERVRGVSGLAHAGMGEFEVVAHCPPTADHSAPGLAC